MGKLFLPAKVPNEGARRLAAFVQSLPSPAAVRRMMAVARIDRPKLDRFIAGEVIPCADERFAITRATGDAVIMRDWSTPPRGRWGDPVPARKIRRAA